MGITKSAQVFDAPVREACDKSCGEKAVRVLVLNEEQHDGATAITMRFFCDKCADECHAIFITEAAAALPGLRA